MNETKSGKARVFLSYSHKDNEIVERIALLLNQRGVDVWYDEWNLQVGSSILKEIQEGIRRADFLVLFLSKSAIESSWVKEEYEASKIRQIETNESLQILPARLDDYEFPLFLSGRIYADFRQSFVFGFSKLLRAILQEQGIDPIDKVFAKYSRQLVEFPHTLKKLKKSDVLKMLESGRNHHWASTRASASSVAAYAEDDNLYRFEKWFGNTIRDYMQYRIYVHSYDFLMSKKIKTFTKTAIVLELLEEIHSRLNLDAYEYGFAKSRGGLEYIATEVEKVMSSFFSERVDAI